MRFFFKPVVIFIFQGICTIIGFFLLFHMSGPVPNGCVIESKCQIDEFKLENCPNNDPEELQNSEIGKKLADFRRSKADPKVLSLQKLLKTFGTKERMLAAECSYNRTLREYWRKIDKKMPRKTDSWQRFFDDIGSCDMYRSDKIVDELAFDMTTLPIKRAEVFFLGGTQHKLLLTYKNGRKALFKPMRYERNQEADPNLFFVHYLEFHTAEIAAYHLDRVLGFRRAIPTVGRLLNLSREIMANADKKLFDTFFWSPGNNLCYAGLCSEKPCALPNSVCGNPFLKEGSLQAYIPVPLKTYKNEYQRTSWMDFVRPAAWQEQTYCNLFVKNKHSFAHGRRLLDYIDMSIMDYLTGNQDRWYFDVFSVFDEYPAYPILMDNGHGFARTAEDDDLLLQPLIQCCVIRPSTLHTLLTYANGPESLSVALHRSVSKDLRSPILLTKHYNAIERRLQKIIGVIYECIRKAENPNDVLMAEFHNTDVPISKNEEENERKDKEEREKDSEEETQPGSGEYRILPGNTSNWLFENLGKSDNSE